MTTTPRRPLIVKRFRVVNLNRVRNISLETIPIEIGDRNYKHIPSDPEYRRPNWENVRIPREKDYFLVYLISFIRTTNKCSLMPVHYVSHVNNRICLHLFTEYGSKEPNVFRE